ncbi:catalase, partial [Undibacterium sp. Di27W]|uniref:catalase n=2 Tax=Undibacterium sp. Di27W TaxID=3413036 RepID=UPI003BF40570
MTKSISPSSTDGAGSVLSTVSGPSTNELPASLGAMDATSPSLIEKVGNAFEVAAAMPENPNKANEYGELSRNPVSGATVEPGSPNATASTVMESVASDKVGTGQPALGVNETIGSLDRVRADGSNQRLTTNQGVPVADNQNSLKIGLRGPTAMEDFILREKITHFDHERIPERVVHARGSAAHGYFDSYKDFSSL